MAGWRDFVIKSSPKWIYFLKSADNPVPSSISYTVDPRTGKSRQTGVEWTGYSNPYKSMGNLAVGSAKALGEGIYRGQAGILGGAAGLVGGAWEGASENDRNGTGFVDGMKNLWHWALTGAKEGAKKGFTNPELLNAALESSFYNIPTTAVNMAARPFSDGLADAINGEIARSPFGNVQRSSNANYEGMMQREYEENESGPDVVARSQQWKNNGENMIVGAVMTKALSKPFSTHPVATTSAVSGVPLAITGGKYISNKQNIENAQNVKDDNIAKTRDFILNNPGEVDDETWSKIEAYHDSGRLSDEDYNAMNDAIGRYKSGVLYGKYSSMPHRMTDEEWSDIGKYKGMGFISEDDYSRMSSRRDYAIKARRLLRQYPQEVVSALINDIESRR